MIIPEAINNKRRVLVFLFKEVLLVSHNPLSSTLPSPDSFHSCDLWPLGNLSLRPLFKAFLRAVLSHFLQEEDSLSSIFLLLSSSTRLSDHQKAQEVNSLLKSISWGWEDPFLISNLSLEVWLLFSHWITGIVYASWMVSLGLCCIVLFLLVVGLLKGNLDNRSWFSLSYLPIFSMIFCFVLFFWALFPKDFLIWRP